MLGNRYTKYLVEVRDAEGNLDFEAEKVVKKEHPYLFSRQYFSIDNLCHYASYGQGRDKPTGPMDLGKFMKKIGVTFRPKTW